MLISVIYHDRFIYIRYCPTDCYFVIISFFLYLKLSLKKSQIKKEKNQSLFKDITDFCSCLKNSIIQNMSKSYVLRPAAQRVISMLFSIIKHDNITTQCIGCTIFLFRPDLIAYFYLLIAKLTQPL